MKKLLIISILCFLQACRPEVQNETAEFDSAVKERNKEWKGYNNTNKEERNIVLAKIDSLDLPNSSFTLARIPQEVKDCKNLKHLNLLNNSDIDWESMQGIEVPSIYVAVKNLNQIDAIHWKQITGIKVSHQELKAIPNNIIWQKQLNYLNVAYNQFITLPEGIGELKKLEKLNLYFNKLTTLPASIGELKNLKYLNLSGNQLTTLPSSIGKLESLTELLLYDNQLTSLPASIGELKNLKKLDLRRNFISKEEIKKLKKISPNCNILHD